MATEATTEQDYEQGDPSGQQMGGMDDDSDFEEDVGERFEEEEEAEPFTDFHQFERYESSDELLHALSDASDVVRKELEDRQKSGARMPRGGIPDSDVYIMEHLVYFLGQCEARVARLPNQKSADVKQLAKVVEDNLSLVERWLDNNKHLHRVTTKGQGGYIHNRSVREAKIQELQKAKQVDFGYLNGALGKVLEGMAASRGMQPDPRGEKHSPKADNASKLLKKWTVLGQKTSQPIIKLGESIIEFFDRFMRQVEQIDKSDPRHFIYKKYAFLL